MQIEIKQIKFGQNVQQLCCLKSFEAIFFHLNIFKAFQNRLSEILTEMKDFAFRLALYFL